MENILNMNYKKINISDNNKYNWDLKRVVYNAASFSYQYNHYLFKISNVYQYNPQIKTIDTRIERKINQYKKLYFEYNYDIINRYPKFWLFGVNLNKKCWQYDINFKKSIIPVLKDNGISYKDNYILNLSVNFNPIGGLKQAIIFK